MKLFKLLTLSLLSLVVFVGCDDKQVEPPFVLKFAINDSKVVNGEMQIADAAYVNYVILDANTNDWVMEYTPKGEWITVTKVSEGNINRIKIIATENDKLESRTATVTFKFNNATVTTLTVKQLGSEVSLEIADGSELHDLPFEESAFNVAVRSNAEFVLSYDPENASEWIKPIIEEPSGAEPNGAKTRAVTAINKTLKFKALLNGLDSRSGKIVFTAGDIVREVTVNQLGEVPDIIVDQTARTLAYDATGLEISLTTNIDNYNVAVEYTDGDSWLTKAPARAMVEGKVNFVVSKNEMAEARSATVVFSYQDSEKEIDITKRVPVTQNGSLRMSITDPAPRHLSFESSAFTVKVIANTALAPVPTIPSWITQVGDATFADGGYTYSFSCGDNNNIVPNSGNIIFAIYSETVELAVTQAAGVILEDQIKVLSATTSGWIATNFFKTHDGDTDTFYESKYNDGGELPVTMVYELEEFVKDVHSIAYYPRQSGNIGSIKKFNLSYATYDDSANFIDVKTYEIPVEQNNKEVKKIVLDSALPNVRYLRFEVTESYGGIYFACAEMQFFRTAIQNDEFLAVTSSTLPLEPIDTASFVPSSGETYDLAINGNAVYTFDCSDGVTIEEKPATRALPERSVKNWTVTVTPNTGLWRAHYVKIKNSEGKVVKDMRFGQASDASKVVTYPDSSYDQAGADRISDADFTGYWESYWGAFGDGWKVYDHEANPISDAEPIKITHTFTVIPSISGITLYPRGGNGDWIKFSAVVITASDTQGTKVIDYTDGRISSTKHFDFTKIENPTQVIITITETNTQNTASMKEIVLWE